MPNPLLARYFHARGVFNDLDVAALPEPQPDALWAAWLTLDDSQRHAMDTTFQDITALSGLAALVVKARVLRTGRAPLARCARRSGYGRTAALVCRRYRPASGTSSFTMRTDVAASDPPSDSARSPRRRPIRGARGEPHLLRSPIPIHSRTVHWVRWNPMQNEGWSEGNKNPGML